MMTSIAGSISLSLPSSSTPDMPDMRMSSTAASTECCLAISMAMVPLSASKMLYSSLKTMRRDWRGPSSSSTISKVRLGFMTWFEARSARTGVSKWIVAGILKQFSVTPAPAGYRRRENPDDRFHQHNVFSSYKSCSIAQEQRLGFDCLQRQHLSIRADRLRSRRSEMALDNDQIRMTNAERKPKSDAPMGRPPVRFS